MYRTTLRLPEPRTVKLSYAARRFDLDQPVALIEPGRYRPRPGDLVLATVTQVGHHPRIELPEGRQAIVHVGDELVLAFGARYAPDEFETEVPRDLGDCHLVSRGGVAGVVLRRHVATSEPTQIRPIGVLARPDGEAWNLRDLALGEPPAVLHPPRMIFVVGTSMNSGKSTVMAGLVRGLSAAGMPVGAAKVTGTASSNDPSRYFDAGAVDVLDFTDAGYATTYQVGFNRLLKIVRDLRAHLVARGADAIVVEIADGLLQPETRALLSSEVIRGFADAVVFAAVDSAGAILGGQWLRSVGLPAVALSGVFTNAPLAVSEVQASIDVPVVPAADMEDPAVALSVVGWEPPEHLRLEAPRVG